MSAAARHLRHRLHRADGESGISLIELLVAAAMSIVLVGAAGSMLISAVRDQPKLSKASQNVTTARWVLERMTREIRNGIAVDSATGAAVSFRAYVRHASCGSSTSLPATSPPIVCEINYDCSSGTKCTRSETEKDVVGGGTPVTILTGIASNKVFNFSPNAEEATFIGVTLRIPAPEGAGGLLTVSDGASLRGGGLFE
jgi:type II secretory pathway pseudopilin PulG